MELIATLKDALGQAPGANAALTDQTITALFNHQLPKELTAGGRQYALTEDAEADALLRHVAGGTWAAGAVRLREQGLGRPGLLVLGFRDAPFADVQAYAGINSIPLAAMLFARLGSDAPDALLALAKSSTAPRVKQAGLAAAIASMPAPPEGVEAELWLESGDPAPLLRQALSKLGPERAGAVALRTLRRHDPDRDFMAQSLGGVLQCFCPQLSGVSGELAVRAAQLAPSMTWEAIGDHLARSGNWELVLAFAQDQASREPGWRRALRAILHARVKTGWALDPAFDALIDPAGAAALGSDVWKMVVRLLESIPIERAEAILAGAPFAKPADALRFLIRNLTPAGLARFAEAFVAAGTADKNGVAGLNLRPLGPAFGPALLAAFGGAKPKPDLVKAIQRNLDAPVFEALSQGLSALKAQPAKAPKAAKAAKAAKKK